MQSIIEETLLLAELITTVSYWILASFWLLVFVMYIANYKHIQSARSTIGVILILTAFMGGFELFNSSFYQYFINDFAQEKQQALQTLSFSIRDLTTENIRVFSAIALLLVFLFWLIPMEVKNREALERRIEESEERFRTITENTTDITIIYDPKKGFTYISPSVAQVIGFSVDDLYGENLDALLHPYDVALFTRGVEKALKSENKTVSVPDFRIRNKAGEWVYFEGRITHMPEVRGVEGVVINCRDIQKRKEAYELLNHRLDMDAMVSRISTDFINTEATDIYAKIENTLSVLGEFSSVDHVYFYQLNDKEKVFDRNFYWKADNCTDVYEDFYPFNDQNYPWMMEKMEMLESIYVPNVSKMPKKAEAEKKVFKEAGLTSLLIVPVSHEGKLSGFLMLDSLQVSTSWGEHDISLLNVIAEIISNALQRFKAEESLKTLSRAVEQSMSSVVILTPKGEIEYVNKKFQESTGYSLNEVVGKHVKEFHFGDDARDRLKEIMKTLERGGEWRGEFLGRKKNGDDLWESVAITAIRNNKNEIKNILSVREDITQKKEYEDKLLYQANYDDLTGLPNRVLANDRLSEAIMRARIERESVAVVIIGLDTFKKVNETLGHDVGDELLVQAAMRLRHYVPELGTLARFGGDEFLMILPVDHDDYAEILASRVLESFSEPFMLNDNEVTVTASLGIALAPNDGDDSQVILRNAGSAMHRAKDEGRNNFQFYAEEMHSDALKRVQMESHLRRAQELGELELFYQPIVSGGQNKVVGAEALLRWTNPELGPVSPADFIPLAEDLGVIVPMGEWILKTACEQVAKWRQIEGAPSYVSVNVSVRQFKGQDFAKVVKDTIAQTGIDGKDLKIEVTESLLVDEEVSGTVADVLKELKSLGVRISLDDFGTGYSSLSYLKKYDFDTLKIDRAFVRDVPDDEDDKALVEAILAMAQSLRMEVVAEGVETKEQLDYLCAQGCDSIQGFYFSKPLPSQQFDDLIANWG